MRLNDMVLRVFLGLARAWQTQAQIEAPEVESLFDETGFFGDIDQIYSRLATTIFFRKAT